METGLIRDSDWEPLDGEVCRVIEFTPLAGRMEGTKVKSSSMWAYASIELESPVLAGPTTGFITHKIDFKHLSEAFSRSENEPDTEVLIFWTRQHYKPGVKLFGRLMPRMWVMLCHKNAYEVWTDEAYRAELDTSEQVRARTPIAQWKPDVMQ